MFTSSAATNTSREGLTMCRVGQGSYYTSSSSGFCPPPPPESPDDISAFAALLLIFAAPLNHLSEAQPRALDHEAMHHGQLKVLSRERNFT